MDLDCYPPKSYHTHSVFGDIGFGFSDLIGLVNICFYGITLDSDPRPQDLIYNMNANDLSLGSEGASDVQTQKSDCTSWNIQNM
jgi:hypothetical protein